jgi:hypothetical protein
VTLPPFVVKALTKLTEWGLGRLVAVVTEPPKPENPLTYKDVAHIQRQIDSATKRRGRD